MAEREMLRIAILPAYLFLAILLGGASAGGYWVNLTLEVLGVLLIVFAVLSRKALAPGVLSWLVLSVLLILVCQFLPIPSELWRALPQREEILASTRMAGFEPHPLFWTLAPHEALKSAVWLLPGLAVLLSVRTRSSRQISWAAWAIAGGMALAVVVGSLQIAGGTKSDWYFYDVTNRGSTVGFFANANHLATLLLVSLPFLSALTIASKKSPRFHLVMSLSAACLLLGLVGIFVNGSLFGYGLVLPVLTASLLLLAPRASFRRWTAAFLVPVVVAGVIFILTTDDGQLMLADSSRISASGREMIFARTWTAIRDFMPSGSGLGTFAEIYRLYENPAEAGRTFINHAHNDYLELVLETGVPGALILTVFLAWWARQAFRIWHDRHMDPFAGAAVIASAIILIHSLVDYPLRTASISCIFAFCIAQMAESRRNKNL